MASSTGRTISVIVPTFEDGELLRRCLASIATQTLPPHEIIVIDDGSTTPSALAGIDDALAAYPLTKLVRQRNAGPSAARNRGVEQAEGAWLVFVDADDELTPDSLERRLAVIESDETLDAVYGSAVFVEPDNQRWASTWPSFNGVLCVSKIGDRDGIPGVLWAYMIKRASYCKLGGLDPALSIMEDFDLLARLGQAGGRIQGIAEPVCIQHRRPSSLARGSARRQMLGALTFLAKARRQDYFTARDLLRRYARVPLAGAKVVMRYRLRPGRQRL